MKRPKVTAAAAAILACLMLALLLAGCDSGQATPGGGGSYAAYDIVFVSWDTPREVLDELAAQGVEPVEYTSGAAVTPATPGLSAKPAVYLCEGTYEADLGSFIRADGSMPLTVTGAGADKTVIIGGGGLRNNVGAAIDLAGSEAAPVAGVAVQGLTLQGFAYGARVRHGSSVTFKEVVFSQNLLAGISFESTTGCTVQDCVIEENGKPYTDDTGYGISLQYGSNGIAGSGNTYRNNANGNIVDYPGPQDSLLPVGNSIELATEYTLVREVKPVVDPIEAAMNAKPGEDDLLYELESAVLTGAAVSTSTAKVEAYSGGGYVFLFDGSITLTVDLPRAGRYRLLVVGTPDEGNNKCDYVQVNDGPRYLTSFLGRKQGQWQTSQPGTENWVNNTLMPQPPLDGWEFNEGVNTITITANWGYCAYDCIYLQEIEGEGGA